MKKITTIAILAIGPRSSIILNQILKITFLGLSFLLPKIASADCYDVGATGRLANYCALDKVRSVKINLRSLQFIDQKLKLEGRVKGLGFPSRLKASSISKNISPILSYSDNINGGNSSEPLVLGNNTFIGNETLYRKEGIVGGLGVGLNGRHIYAERRYLNYSINSSYTRSLKYGSGISSNNASFCSINHIKDWWFVDACTNLSTTNKEITDSKNNNISLVGSKVYSSDKNTYNEATLGMNLYHAETFTQNQLLIGYKTIHSNGLYSAVNLTLGEGVENQLTTQFAIKAQLTAQINNKPLNLSINHTNSGGGMLLGFERNQSDIGILVSYPVWGYLDLNLGYRKSNSNIDYYDSSTPTFGIQFKPYKF
tara:strand:+ start:400 stop:1506 length:1107 start_codon:yes stop_codon:yes gene_type:complete